MFNIALLQLLSDIHSLTYWYTVSAISTLMALYQASLPVSIYLLIYNISSSAIPEVLRSSTSTLVAEYLINRPESCS